MARTPHHPADRAERRALAQEHASPDGRADRWPGPRWAMRDGTARHARSVATPHLGDRVRADRNTVAHSDPEA